MRFQAVANRIARREPVGELLECALKRADRVLEEGRDRVLNLREGAGNVGELAQAIVDEDGDRFAVRAPRRLFEQI